MSAHALYSSESLGQALRHRPQEKQSALKIFPSIIPSAALVGQARPHFPQSRQVSRAMDWNTWTIARMVLFSYHSHCKKDYIIIYSLIRLVKKLIRDLLPLPQINTHFSAPICGLRPCPGRN